MAWAYNSILTNETGKIALLDKVTRKEVQDGGSVEDTLKYTTIYRAFPPERQLKAEQLLRHKQRKETE